MRMRSNDSSKLDISHCELMTLLCLGQMPSFEVAHPLRDNFGKMFDYRV
jgi:hypothetical protein